MPSIPKRAAAVKLVACRCPITLRFLLMGFTDHSSHEVGRHVAIDFQEIDPRRRLGGYLPSDVVFVCNWTRQSIKARTAVQNVASGQNCGSGDLSGGNPLAQRYGVTGRPSGIAYGCDPKRKKQPERGLRNFIVVNGSAGVSGTDPVEIGDMSMRVD